MRSGTRCTGSSCWVPCWWCSCSRCRPAWWARRAGCSSAGGRGRPEVSLLATKSLVKHFGETHAVDHVDFTVREREVLALIGSNGAGKTTLVNLISGLFPPDAGQILFQGHDVTHMSALRPTLLFLDEPTSGVSTREKAPIMDTITSVVRREGISAAIIEHDMDVVFNYSDRIVAMHQGAILADGTPAEIRRNEIVTTTLMGTATAP